MAPRLLMAEPESFDASVVNNELMAEIPDARRKVDRSKAREQWVCLYRALVQAGATVYLLGAGRTDIGLQDLPFVANLGVSVPEADLLITAKFSSPVRTGEESHGEAFFRGLGFGWVLHAPYAFEGEAEMKRIAPSVYCCGYGIRSELRAYQWMRSVLEHSLVSLIPLRLTEPKMYHLDCALFPLQPHVVAMATSAFTKSEVKSVEPFAEIIDVPLAASLAGACNLLRVGSKLFSFAYPHSAVPADITQRSAVEYIAKRAGCDIEYHDLTEFVKAGADLSCLAMHLDYANEGA